MNDHDDSGIKENFREQDIYLPIANVARIMKNAVPQTGKVSGVGFVPVDPIGDEFKRCPLFADDPQIHFFFVFIYQEVGKMTLE